MKKIILTFFAALLLLINVSYADIACRTNNRKTFMQMNDSLYEEYSNIDAGQKVPLPKKAFWLQGDAKVNKALFLAHGYMGSPGEMKYLAEPFIKEGWTVVGFLIPGHGSTFEVSNKYKYERWVKDINLQLKLMTDCFSEVRAIGFSTGGLLLHHFAMTEKVPPSLKGLHLVSPYFIQRFGGVIDRILGNFVDGISVDTAYFISRFKDLKVMTIDRQYYHQNVPIETAFQVKELGKKVFNLKGAKKLNLPVQVFLSTGDWTVDIEKSKELLEREYENVSLVWYDGSEPHHLMVPSVSKKAPDLQKLIFELSK